MVSPSLVAGDGLADVDSEQWADDYDRYFRKYSKRFFGPFFDWRWFKAQAIAESKLDEKVVSERGAQGLMQIMPDTFAEIRERNPHFSDVASPKWNIAAGIYYDRMLYKRWSHPSGEERLFLTLASYNAGFGRVRSANRKAGGGEDTSWNETRKFVPGETQHYVKNIQRLMRFEEKGPRRIRGISQVLKQEEEQGS
ncbi:MAG: transglycosylase SLT domain-containing protein [Gammaproteobacteria bacterium]|nr:transglycosylase SLT domain-containing protein [Gammaproteobacteria bacterium]